MMDKFKFILKRSKEIDIRIAGNDLYEVINRFLTSKRLEGNIISWGFYYKEWFGDRWEYYIGPANSNSFINMFDNFREDKFI